MNNIIEIKNLRKVFGDNEVLKNITISFPEGSTTSILGLSGCGKSTTIKHIVSLLTPTSGNIFINGKNITKFNEEQIRENRKNIGYLFQDGALFDSMNIFENISFPLREHLNLTKKEIIYKVSKVLQMVGLTIERVGKLNPNELSGGMRKRVGLARAIIMEPRIILYDEPTSGLDPITSNLITEMILKLQKELNITSILITHDLKETFKSSDYIAFLFNGEIIEYCDVDNFKKSSNLHVQQFINGSSNGPIQF